MQYRSICGLVIASLYLLCAGFGSAFAEDDFAKASDRYQVPDGNVEELLTFLTGLETYRPKTTDEILAYRQHALKALTTTAERILSLENDASSKAHHKANSVLLQLRLGGIQRASAKGQQDYFKDIAKHLQNAKPLAQQDLALAYTFGQMIEQIGNVELAVTAYREFGKVFSGSSDEELAGYGEKMTGIGRRLELPGKKMKIEGETAAGEAFDWESYRGKVVLVDYWATWCGPCIEELPNVKENYEKYHAKGFDVVGISLDSDPARLNDFLAKQEVPWKTLFTEGAGWDHPMAKYYGVMGIPQTILVDRQGKVLAMGVYGGELGRRLESLLGAADPTPAAAGE